jgi:hypothetical protein
MKNFWNFRPVSFSVRLLQSLFPILFISILFAFQSCNKEPGTIGTNLKNDLLNAAFTDTTTLFAYSILEDTLNTTNLNSNFLGYLLDEVFGTTIAGIYTQFVPNATSFALGDNPIVDSIVLTLRYTGGFYGDTLNPFKIEVYRLTEDISSDKIYYQNNSFKYDDTKTLTLMDEFILYPKPNTKIKVDSLVDAHLRIRLSDQLGEEFVDEIKTNNGQMTDAAFKKFFKGLFINPIPLANEGSLVSFNLSSIVSGIQLYYKNNDVPRRLSFPIVSRTSPTRRVSTYNHDYNRGNDDDFKQQVLENDTLLGKKILYVQSMGGVKTKISFPNIKALRGKRIVINKAELIITNFEENISKYPPPERLSLQAINQKGELVFLPDHTNLGYWGGGYDKTKQEYRFRITRYIQDIILKDNLEPYIYLVAEGAARYANRLLLHGTYPSELYADKRLRLEIYYTEY